MHANTRQLSNFHTCIAIVKESISALPEASHALLLSVLLSGLQGSVQCYYVSIAKTL